MTNNNLSRKVLPSQYLNHVLDLYFGLSMVKDTYQSRKHAKDAVTHAERLGYDISKLEWIAVDGWTEDYIKGWLTDMSLDEEQIKKYLTAYKNGQQ